MAKKKSARGQSLADVIEAIVAAQRRRPHREQLEEIEISGTAELPPTLRELIDAMLPDHKPTTLEGWRALCIALAWHIDLRLAPLYEARVKQKKNLAGSRSKNTEVRKNRKAWNHGQIERAVFEMFEDPNRAWLNKTIVDRIQKMIGTGDILIVGAKAEHNTLTERTVLNIIKPIAAKWRAENRKRS